ncbi:MAG: hypothetical protein HQ534_14305 [Armatimonadetes bacterium]|nr:hypothetical protein [Armatimonadota bacterium]
MKILFISNNWYKKKIVEEVSKEQGLELDFVESNLHLYDTESLKDNIFRILNELFLEFKKPILIAKSGLFIEGYQDFPGIRTDFISKTIGMPGLFRLIGNNAQVSVNTVVGFFDGNRTLIEELNLEGSLKNKSNQEGWFFDPYFFPKNNDKSMSEMDEESKKELWSLPFRKIIKRIIQR